MHTRILAVAIAIGLISTNIATASCITDRNHPTCPSTSSTQHFNSSPSYRSGGGSYRSSGGGGGNSGAIGAGVEAAVGGALGVLGILGNQNNSASNDDWTQPITPNLYIVTQHCYIMPGRTEYNSGSTCSCPAGTTKTFANAGLGDPAFSGSPGTKNPEYSCVSSMANNAATAAPIDRTYTPSSQVPYELSPEGYTPQRMTPPTAASPPGYSTANDLNRQQLGGSAGIGTDTVAFVRSLPPEQQAAYIQNLSSKQASDIMNALTPQERDQINTAYGKRGVSPASASATTPPQAQPVRSSAQPYYDGNGWVVDPGGRGTNCGPGGIGANAPWCR